MQNALQDVQFELKESKDMLLKEREAAKQVAEQVPVIKEVPVVDQEIMDKLSAENETLKVNWRDLRGSSSLMLKVQL